MFLFRRPFRGLNGHPDRSFDWRNNLGQGFKVTKKKKKGMKQGQQKHKSSLKTKLPLFYQMLVRIYQAGSDSSIDPVCDPLHFSFAPPLSHQIPFFDTPETHLFTVPSTAFYVLDPELIHLISTIGMWGFILITDASNPFKNMVSKSRINYLLFTIQVLPDDIDI